VLLPLTPAWANDQAQTPASAPVTPPATTAVAAPPPSPMPWPGMSAGLAANPNPTNFDAGPFGKITVDGVLSGLALTQSHPALDFFGNQNKHSYADISNAQLIINKSSGIVQFYVQAGAYSLPALGTPYLKAVNSGNSGTFGATEKFYGPVPQGLLKLVRFRPFKALNTRSPSKTTISSEVFFGIRKTQSTEAFKSISQPDT
jgi:hypothetical protein